jgi:cytochrome c7-like protein/class III cytochrome C family protein
VAQVFRPVANTLAVLAIASIGAIPILLIGLGYALTSSPYVTDQSVTKKQPVPFSHAHHVGGLGLDCRYCHASVEKTRFAEIPPTETCMTCHSQIWTNASMLAPVRESLATKVPIHWQRVHNLPDYVYFDHSIHVAKGVGCSTCHGRVDRMPLMRQAAPLTMGWCLDCHRNPASAVRPHDKVFDMNWTPPEDQIAQGRRLMTEYHIDAAHLTDCSKCHR